MKSIILICLIIYNFNGAAQTNLISSIETEASYGLGGGKYGFFFKANHNWIKKEQIVFTSSISTAYFYQKEELQTSIYNRTGFIDDLHFNFHSGLQYLMLKSNKLYVLAELYAGYYYLKEKGKYESTSIVFTQNNYTLTDNVFDWGTHIGLGYYLTNKIGVQVSITNSFNDFEVFSGSKYSKIFYGLGVTYCINKISD